jgi:hypothetical protein
VKNKMTTYSAAVSNQVNVDVIEPTVVTQLTAVASVSTANVNEVFAVSGMLTAADGSVPVNQTIQLQMQQTDGTFADVSGATGATDETGAYTIPVSEVTAATYAFQTTYAGGSA